MTTLFDSAPPVKSESFGRGIQPARRRPFVPSLEDLNWAAQFFGRSGSGPSAGRAGPRSAWYHQFDDTMPPTGHCLNCGDRCDDLTTGALRSMRLTRIRRYDRVVNSARSWPPRILRIDPRGKDAPIPSSEDKRCSVRS